MVERTFMSRFHSLFASAVLAGVGAFAIAATPGSVPGFGSGSAAAIDNGPSKYVCMTDDGYGRLRSCSACESELARWRQLLHG